MCRLVPHHVINESIKGIDPSAGPAADAAVPRRVLELLRKQLDFILAEWMRDNATKVATAEEKHAQSAWAQSVLDHAKRVQDRKRPAESSAEAANVAAKSSTSPAASAPEVHMISSPVLAPAEPAEPPMLATIVP